MARALHEERAVIKCGVGVQSQSPAEDVEIHPVEAKEKLNINLE